MPTIGEISKEYHRQKKRTDLTKEEREFFEYAELHKTDVFGRDKSRTYWRDWDASKKLGKEGIRNLEWRELIFIGRTGELLTYPERIRR